MKLPALISDGMVLQRDKRIKVWGKTLPQQKVFVSIAANTYYTYGNENGDFEIVIDELKAGGPYEMELNDGESRILRNILVGDVWVLNGQSNMELPIRRTLDLYEEEVSNAYEDRIRMFMVPMRYDFHSPVKEVEEGRWISVTPEQVLDFSAVGYFFAGELLKTYQVPIGLIQTAVGGTPIEAWLSEDVLLKIGGYEQEIKCCKEDSYVEGIKIKDVKENNEWFARLNEKDIGIQNAWHKEEEIPKDWEGIHLPAYFDQEILKGFHGSIWLKRSFTLSKNQWKEDAKLVLGTLVDADETYINGTLIGSTGYRYPPRRYRVPEGILRPGANMITVRLISTQNMASFIPDMPYFLVIGKERIPLAGEWRYQIGKRTEQLPKPTFFQYKPTGVYHGMLYPIRNYGIKGLAFYQGESNTERPGGYEQLFRAYIKGIRSLFQEELLPIVYVQLANFMDGEISKTSNRWAELREEQRRALKGTNTAMVVTIDLGEYNELHPQNKKDVGRRMALAARGIAYGEKITYSGPNLESIECSKGVIIVRFTSAEAGFSESCYKQDINGFEISYDGTKFYEVTARAKDNYIILDLEGDEIPTALRYAFRDCPRNLNLYNKEGLPATPFITTIYCGIK